MENLWDAEIAIITRRYYIIDAETAQKSPAMPSPCKPILLNNIES